MTEKAAPPVIPTISRGERDGPAQREGKGGGAATSGGHPYRVHLPGFIRDQDIGLGDVMTRTTSLFGIKPCGGCDRRAAALNRWMIFSSRQSR